MTVLENVSWPGSHSPATTLHCRWKNIHFLVLLSAKVCPSSHQISGQGVFCYVLNKLSSSLERNSLIRFSPWLLMSPMSSLDMGIGILVSYWYKYKESNFEA